jgi:putative membrane protein (TIGR04086 family)
VLKGISASFLVVALTLLAGVLWYSADTEWGNISGFVDVGLIVSCLVGGYRTGKESGGWFLGGIAGASFVALSAALMTLFLPVTLWGAAQVIAEGAVLGSLAGVLGARGEKRHRRPIAATGWNRYDRASFYENDGAERIMRRSSSEEEKFYDSDKEAHREGLDFRADSGKDSGDEEGNGWLKPDEKLFWWEEDIKARR